MNHAEFGQAPYVDSREPRVEDALVDFLVARLTEDLAQLWERDDARAEGDGGGTRPGLAAQLAIVDELLVTLRSGLLPGRRELRILLYGYGTHRDYDPSWTRRLNGPT